jgi:hypothetical protein
MSIHSKIIPHRSKLAGQRPAEIINKNQGTVSFTYKKLIRHVMATMHHAALHYV